MVDNKSYNLERRKYNINLRIFTGSVNRFYQNKRQNFGATYPLVNPRPATRREDGVGSI